MISAFSRCGRRLLCRLPGGSDLLPCILALCDEERVRSGVFTVSGFVEQAEISTYDSSQRRPAEPRRLSAPSQIVSLSGSLGELDAALHATAQVVLARQDECGVQMIAGTLLGARVLSAEVVIDAFDDLIVRKQVDPKSGLLAWSELIEAGAASARAVGEDPQAQAEREAHAIKEARLQVLREGNLKPASAAPSARSDARADERPAGWEQVVQASRRLDEGRAAAPPDEAEEVHVAPVRGDVLDHPTFGRCSVERYEEMQDRISVRVRGRLVQIALENFQLVPMGKEGAHRVFRFVRRRDGGR